MSKIVAVIAVLMLALGATAAAAPLQDYRSPDARQAVAQQVQQDYRSPDARVAAATSDVPAAAQDLRSPDGGWAPYDTAPVLQDLRSPDGGPTGAFAPPVPASSPAVEPTGDSFAWGYLAAALAAVLILSALLVTYRRHHGLAPGH